MNMKIKFIKQANELSDMNYNNCEFNFTKPCTCTFLCLSRAVIDGTEVSSNRYIGSVHEPFACCNLVYLVNDENKNVKYRIAGDCCQSGFFFCSDIFFNIYPEGNSEMKKENAIGKITKKWTDCIKEVCTNANNFTCDFPENATAEDKILLIALTLFIDYTLFEKEKGQN